MKSGGGANSKLTTANTEDSEGNNGSTILSSDSDNSENSDISLQTLSDGEEITWIEVSTADDLNFENQGNLYIKLTDNISMSGSFVVSSGSIVLDLNGKSFTVNGSGVAIKNTGSNLTIRDSSEDSTGSIVATNDVAIWTDSGNTTIESGKISSDSKSAVYVSGGTLTVDGGNFSSTILFAVLVSGGETTINGGSFSSSVNVAVKTTGGKTLINGGDFNATYADKAYMTWQYGGILLISGGTYRNQYVTSGGTINGTIDSDQEKFKVTPPNATNAVACVVSGDSTLYYVSIKVAIADSCGTEDAPTVITMLQDSSEFVNVSEGKYITLDLNGKKLSNYGKGVVIKNNGGWLIIKDSSEAKTGSVASDESGDVAVWAYAGTTAIESGSYLANNTNGKSVIYAQGGTTTISGGSFNSSGEVALWVKGGSVIVNGGHFSTKSNCKNVAYVSDSGSLAINGGDFEVNNKIYPTIYVEDGTAIIKGGYFNDSNVTCGGTIIGKVMLDSNTEKYVVGIPTVDRGNAVVQLGEDDEAVYYGSISNAILASSGTESSPANIKLLKNVNENVVVEDNQFIVFDLNGQTLSNENTGGYTIQNSGCLTIVDGSSENTGKVTNTYGGSGWYTVVNSAGTLTINAGAFGYDYYAGGDLLLVKGGTINIKGGIFSSSNVMSLIEIFGGTVNISNGLFDTSKTSSQTIISLAKYSNEDSSTDNRIVNISGGVFNNPDYSKSFARIIKNESFGTVCVTGGRYTVALKGLEYICSNKSVFSDDIVWSYAITPYVNTNGAGNETYRFYTYCANQSVDVAEVNGQNYKSLQDAINAASDTNEVKLLTSISVKDVSIAKPITLDLNGNCITTESGTGFSISANTTFKNGNFYGNGVAFESTAGEVTLDGVRFLQEEGNTYDATKYTAFIAGGTSTVTIKADGSFAAPTVKDGSVCVNGVATLNVYGSIYRYSNGEGKESAIVTGNSEEDNPIINIYEGAYVYMNDTSQAAIDVQNKATVNIYGGTLNGREAVVRLSNGGVNILGGVLTSTGYKTDNNVPSNGAVVEVLGGSGSDSSEVNVTISGGTLFSQYQSVIYEYVESDKQSSLNSISISGGEFNSEYRPTEKTTSLKDVNVTNKSVVSISGGTFSRELDSSFIALNRVIEANSNGSYSVVPCSQITVFPTANENLTYNGEAQFLITAGTSSNGTLQYKLGADGVYSSDVPSGTKAGKYDIYYKVVCKDGHDAVVVEDPIVVEIAKAESLITTAPAAKSGLVANGTAQELVTDGATSGGTLVYSLTEDGDFVDTIPTGTAAGTYTVYYKVVGDENHADSEIASVNVTISTPYYPSTSDTSSTPSTDQVLGTTTETDPVTGTVTETTETSEGTTIKETTTDGTVTETVKDTDGNTTKITVTETDATGEVTQTTETNYNADKSFVTTTTTATGITQETKVDADNNVTEVNVTVADTAVTDGAVALPDSVVVTAASKSEGAPAITVTAPEGTLVTVPVEQDSATLVVVAVAEDGSEQIVKIAPEVDGGVVVPVDNGEVTFKVIDNAKTFTDVRDGEWYTETVAKAAAREIMNGVGDTGEFQPEGTTTRAMMAQILFNVDNAISTGTTANFTDLVDGAWYTDAVSWAAGAGITTGYDDGTFDPEGNVTREQAITMIWRYAGKPSASTSALSKFSDADNVSDYAKEALAWAAEVGILQGNNGQILAGDSATRAELAALTLRFCTL